MKNNTTSKKWIGILSPALMLAFSSGSALAAPTPVTACGTVLSTNGDYILTKDITCASKPALNGAIVITGRDVHLNLNGHTLNGNGLAYFGIATIVNSAAACSGANNAQITSGRITGFTVGVYLCAAQPGTQMNAQVTNLNVTGNVIAMQTLNSDNNQIRTNNLSVSSGGDGLDITGSNNHVQDNVIYGDNNNNAIYIQGNNNEIQGNFVANSKVTGIGVNGNNNHIHQNVVSGSVSYGIITFPGTTGNQIEQNTAFNNGADLGDNDSCKLNQWQHNLFATANNSCIQ